MNEEKTEEKTVTVEEAALALENDKRRRIAELDAILRHEAQRLRVDVQAVPFLTEDGRVVAQLRYVAR